jgi:tetratricopeptide (TPR) repeat protein
MTNTRDNLDRAAEIVARASALSGAERAAYLREACGDDDALRAEVDSMLAGHEESRTAPTSMKGVETVAAAPREEVGQMLGRYKLLEPIGEGGFGTVWAAEQREPIRRRVAIKVIKLGMDTKQVIARFEAERQALAMMDHPNIAKVLDAGCTETGRPYFVMELVKGVPILEYCDTERLDARSRLDLFTKVCHAIQHAHQKGIIHRDIKPNNVLITLHDGMPVPKVIDFGIAKATNQELTEKTLYTQHRQMMGTPAYMSPEQAEMSGLDIDTRSDIYALGVLLYELLTGTTPFDSDELMSKGFAEMMRIIREVEPHKPSTRLISLGDSGTRTAQLRHAVDPKKLSLAFRGDLDWIVMKCLEKDRTRRYETASGLAADIERHLNDEPVTAGAPSAGYRLRKFVRRHRGRVIGAGAVVVALALGVAAVVTVQVRANLDLAAKNAELADEQAKVDARNEELAAERTRALDRFDMAVKAIEALHTGVSEDVLLRNDQFKELRTKLLRQAAGFYADLEGLLAGQTDTRSQKTLATAYFQLAVLTDKIGSKREALEVHRKALAIRRELAAAPGADTETRLNVARCLDEVGGILSAIGDRAGAQAAYEEQRNLAEQLESLDPNDAVRLVLAQSHHGLGVQRMETGQHAAAMEACGKALAIRQELAEANPGEREFQNALAASHNVVGDLHSESGKLAEAMESYRRALAIRQKLADTDPADTEIQIDLARSRDSVGDLLTRTGKPVEAMESYRAALAIRQKLAEGNPAITEYQVDLAASLNDVGTRLFQTAQLDEAMEAAHKALAIHQRLVDDNPSVTEFQRSLAGSYQMINSVLMATGKPEEAVQAYRSMLAVQQKLADDNPDDLGLQTGVAENHESFVGILAGAGKLAEAIDVGRKAISIRRRLADANPADTQFQLALSRNYTGVGLFLMQMGKPAEAIEAHRSALAIQEKLADANPTVTQFQISLAGSLSSVGAALLEAGRFAEAMEAYRKALAIQQKLADDNPSDLGSQMMLAQSQFDIGHALACSGRPAEAMKLFHEATALQKKLADADPANVFLQSFLASRHSHTGVIWLNLGKPAEALDAFRKASTIQQKLVDANPNLDFHQALLARIHNNSGRALYYQSRFVEAFTELDAAVAIKQRLADVYPTSIDHVGSLAFTHVVRGDARVRTGQPVEAATDLRRALELWSKLPHLSAELRFERARALALLAGLGAHPQSGVTADEAATFADQAVAALADVLALWDYPNQLEWPEFDSVRDRPEFQELLVEADARAREPASPQPGR